MKNGIFIGILLILIGLIVLLNNLGLLDLSLVEIIKVYWPVILIWLGIDKLLRNK
jgi:lia operon protein LiaF